MSRQLELKGRQFLILSEPNVGPAWRATVMEVKQGGTQEPLGIDATADTRAAADDAAERELRRLLKTAH
jgi:hypothetical protein